MGTAAELVVTPDVPPGRLALFCEVTDTALVLGSTQSPADADEATCAARGVTVVRRRCGGGAVLVRPGAQLWLDAFVPAGDPLLESDVARSFGWLGSVWATAISKTLGSAEPGTDAAPDAAAVWSGGASPVEVTAPSGRPSAWARRLCFGSIGAGEVTLAGRKVVGIAQRRGRAGAWFHSMAPVADSSRALVECMAFDHRTSRQALDQLAVVSSWLPVAPADLRAALAAVLV